MKRQLHQFLLKLTGREVDPEDQQTLEFDGGGSTPTDVVLGLDFGTSCTKAVIRMPYVPGAPAFVVPFKVPAGTSHLLTVSHVEKALAIPSGLLEQNLKVQLIVSPENREVQAAVVAVLAHAMRAARGWFLSEKASAYKKYKPRWSCNLGVASAGYEQDRIREVMQDCGSRAWLLSLGPSQVAYEEAVAALEEPVTPATPVYVVPEIAAAAEGFRRSVFGEPGMYVMMDIGASTLDVCGFTIRSSASESPFGLMATSVSQLGAAVLHDLRCRAASSHGYTGPALTVDPRDPLSAVPGDLTAYAGPTLFTPHELQAVDATLSDQCQLAVRRVVGGMYKKNPNATQWKKGVKLFMVGGGARMNFYQDVPREIRRTKAESVAWAKLEVQPLGTPTDLLLEGASDTLAFRFAVAYGLSYPRPDFGEFTNPSDLPDMEPPPSAWLDALYVGKEMV